MRDRWRDHGVVVISAVLAVVLLGPALGGGYALIGDQVFVPDQVLLPWMVGLGGGLPRAVPQDAVVAALTGLVPGWVWQDVALVSALVLLGTGVARVVRPAGRRAALVAAVVAVWSPYVGERQLLGHWSLLLAVGVLPWALHLARSARDGEPGAWARWLVVVALASLTVTGGVLVVLVSGPVLVWAGTAQRARAWVVLAAGVVLQAPWAVPGVLHSGSASTGGADVFALRAEGPWGAVVTALGTGGVWNAAAVPDSRSSWLAPVLTAVLLALAVVGARAMGVAVGRPVAVALVVAALAGLVVAILGAWGSGALAWAVVHLPAGGLLRDGQKWLAPWLILLSCAAGCGAAVASRAATRRSGDVLVGGALIVGLLVLPVACVPDLAWGSLGRLAAVRYPDDWARVRAVLAADPAPGDVVALPWSAFRDFDWNLGRTVLDPAPRYLTRTVVASQDLVVRHDGELVVVEGDDPRSARIGAVVASGGDLAPVLRAEGVGWALVEDVAGSVPTISGSVAVVDGPGLRLYRLDAPTPAPAAEGVLAVVLANLAALGVVVAGAGAALRARFGHGRR